MQPKLIFPKSRLIRLLAIGFLAACASSQPWASSVLEPPKSREIAEHEFHLLNRLTWGASMSAVQQLASMGRERYLEHQLKPPPRPRMAPPVQAQIDAMAISQRPFDQLVLGLEKQRRNAVAIKDNPEHRKAALKEYRQEVQRLAREAAARAVLRGLYSPYQLHEKMSWFWMNHFSVYQRKGNVGAMVADYEENAIRPHALGRFRVLLGSAARHPAMLRYLDNARNAANRINENYARELMELHTLGANGGYTQNDIQELARILTGIGINLTAGMPEVPAGREGHYVRQGLFEFNPNRHDYGEKVFLGQPIAGRGLGELDQALDLLARHPSTARFMSRKLALFFVADDPPAVLVERMAQVFQSSDGDIAATLRVLLDSPEFAASAGLKFKDPLHYVLSAVRFAYDDLPITTAAPIINWLNRMGEGLYNRTSPDGYPLTQVEWASPGQMTTRFEFARTIGSGSAGLFDAEGQGTQVAAVPRLSSALYGKLMQKTLSPMTQKALAQARSPQEWNTYLLSSPEFMSR